MGVIYLVVGCESQRRISTQVGCISQSFLFALLQLLLPQLFHTMVFTMLPPTTISRLPLTRQVNMILHIMEDTTDTRTATAVLMVQNMLDITTTLISPPTQKLMLRRANFIMSSTKQLMM